MTYAKVSQRFWRDPKVRQWSDSTKLLAQYLLTCSHRNTEGLFWAPLDYMAADLGWSTEGVSEGLATLAAEGFAEYDHDAQALLIVKAIKYDPPRGDKSVKGALNALGDVPPTRLLGRLLEVAREHAPDLAEAIEDPGRNGPVRDHLDVLEGASEGHHDDTEGPPKPRTQSLTQASSQEPPGGGADAPAATNGHDRRSFTARCADWLDGQGITLPPSDRQLERRRMILQCVLDEAGDDADRQRQASMGMVRDYVADLTGAKVSSDAGALLARLVGEFGGVAVLDAVGEAMTWGAGLGEAYRDDPLALAKYVSAVLHGERQGAA